jgi:hypothetical protein
MAARWSALRFRRSGRTGEASPPERELELESGVRVVERFPEEIPELPEPARRFEVDDHSTNVFWLALPSLGESWHHNHHAFPRSAEHGLRRWELDPSALVIRAMERPRVGLERDPDRARAPGGQDGRRE